MGYPRRLLGDDEEIVLDMHPHWKVLVAPALVLVVVIGLASFGYFAMPDGSSQGLERLIVLIVALVVVVVFPLVRLLRWRTTNYVVTTRRVVIRTGLLSRSGRDVPLSRVNDVSFQHTLFERLLGCGTLTVESAGERGQVVLNDIPRVETVQREIYRLVEAEDVRRRGMPVQTEE